MGYEVKILQHWNDGIIVAGCVEHVIDSSCVDVVMVFHLQHLTFLLGVSAINHRWTFWIFITHACWR
jgi:hypothetical protein